MKPEKNRNLRGHRFYPTDKELTTLPKLGQAGKGAADIVHLHYFCAAGDWWLTEVSLDKDDRLLGFGYCQLAAHPDGAELGYVDLEELEELKVDTGGFPVIVERDLFWEPKPLSECIPKKA